MAESGDGAADTVGVGATVAVSSGAVVSSGSAVSVSSGAGVGVASSVGLSLPPNTLVERSEPLTEWPKIASSEAVTTAPPITAASRPVRTASFHHARFGRRSGVRRPNGSSSGPHARSGPSPRAPTPDGCSARTAAPVALRRVTRGVTCVITFAGRFRPSLTSATMIGVMAVASSDPRSQNIGTITAAATAAALEITRVWIEIPLVFSSFSGLTPSTLAVDLGARDDVVAAVRPAHPGLVAAVVIRPP